MDYRLSQQGGCAQEGWLRKPAALEGGGEEGTQNTQLLWRFPLSQLQSPEPGCHFRPSVGRGAAATALLPVRRDQPTRPAELGTAASHHTSNLGPPEVHIIACNNSQFHSIFQMRALRPKQVIYSGVPGSKGVAALEFKFAVS